MNIQPKPPKRTVHVQLTMEQYGALQKLARESLRTEAAYLRQLLCLQIRSGENPLKPAGWTTHKE